VVGRRARQPFFLARPPEAHKATGVSWNADECPFDQHPREFDLLELPGSHRRGTFLPRLRQDSAAAPGQRLLAFFGLPRKLRLDAAELEKRFHRLSWKLRSDSFVRTGEYERELSLDRSSQLNDAYRTLRNPVSRVEYLLALEEMRKEAGKAHRYWQTGK
jgi:hypothetical protein